MENLKKVELIAQRLEAGAGGWVSSMQNLDCLLAAVQAIEMQEAEAALRKMAAGLTLPELHIKRKRENENGKIKEDYRENEGEGSGEFPETV